MRPHRVLCLQQLHMKFAMGPRGFRIIHPHPQKTRWKNAGGGGMLKRLGCNSLMPRCSTHPHKKQGGKYEVFVGEGGGGSGYKTTVYEDRTGFIWFHPFFPGTAHPISIPSGWHAIIIMLSTLTKPAACYFQYTCQEIPLIFSTHTG